MAHTGYQVVDFSGVIFSDRAGRSVSNALDFKRGNIYEIITNSKKPILIQNFTYLVGTNEVRLPDFMTNAFPLLNVNQSTGALSKFSNGFWGLYFGVHRNTATQLYDITIVATPNNKVYLSITGRNV